MKTIFVRFEKVAFHNWAAAPEHRSYLRARHRHKFYIEARVEVGHGDREVEFHDLLDKCSTWAENCLGGDSCENMAEALVGFLVGNYGGNRLISASISEDDECGGGFTHVSTKKAP